MKKIGNRPITEADTDFSKLQKNQKSKIKNQKISENFRDLFFFLLLSNYFLQRSMRLLFLLHESNEFNVH